MCRAVRRGAAPAAALTRMGAGLQVPNVKFNAAKIMAKLAPLLERQVINNHIKPCLAELCEDSDIDVRFYAREALSAFDSK